MMGYPDPGFDDEYLRVRRTDVASGPGRRREADAPKVA